VREFIQRAFGDTRGSIAMMFAVALPTAVVASGVAVDYSQSSSARTTLQAAADAAALAAAQNYMANGGSKTSAESAGLSVLRANFEASKPAQATLDASALKMTASSPPTFEATGRATVKNVFGGVVGSLTTSVDAAATAAAATGSPKEMPTDLIIAMDVSASMGLASSVEGRKTLGAAVTDHVAAKGGDTYYNNCAFACHWQNLGGSTNKSTLDLARENKVEVRFDVQRDVVRAAIDDLMKGGNKADHRIALYTFSTGLTKVEGLTDNRGQLISTLVKQDFETKGTTYETTFPSLKAEIQSLIQSKQMRQASNKTLLIITDGMRTIPWQNDSVDIYAIRESSCNIFKDLGINVAIMELKYIPESIDTHWNFGYFSTQLPLIGPTLKSCATTPSLYAVAGEANDIIASFSKLSKEAVTAKASVPRLIK
jgi:Flp pilus assembly protein TadG